MTDRLAGGGRAPVSVRELLPMALAAAVVGMLYLLYCRIGTVWTSNGVQQATIPWMVTRMQTTVTTYGPTYHLLFWATPLISIGIVWRDRWALLDAPKRRNVLGFLLVAACLFAHWAGVKTEHLRLSALSLIGITWSIPFFLFGWAVARRLLFPCAFLVFCVPLNFLDGAILRLRVLAIRAAALVLNGMGLPCVQRGTALYSTEEGGFVLQSQSLASGFNALLVVVAMGALYAFLYATRGRRDPVRGWLVFLGAVPAFLAANLLYMTGSGILVAVIGQGAAVRLEGVTQTISLYALTALCLWGWGYLLRKDWKQWGAAWTQRALRPSG